MNATRRRKQYIPGCKYQTVILLKRLTIIIMIVMIIMVIMIIVLRRTIATAIVIWI